jgi:hypothetical protein
MRDILESTGAVRDPGTPRGTSKRSDPTPMKVIQIDRLDALIANANAWVSAIDETYDYYYGTFIEEMARSFYGQDVKLGEFAKSHGMDRRIVGQLRDKFVCTCALCAAARGLVEVKKEGG